MDIRFLDPPSPTQARYQVTFTPEELAVIKERGLQNRLVLDLSPRGNIEDVRRKIAEKQRDYDQLEQEFQAAIRRQQQQMDNPNQDWTKIDFSRSARIVDRQIEITNDIEELKKLEARLADPTNVITIGNYLIYEQGVIDTRTFNTTAEARQFEIDIEKALRALEKYLAPFIPVPEEPEQTLPIESFSISPERWFQSVWLICPPGGGKTTALLSMVNSFIVDVISGDATIIIIDGQGQDQSLLAPVYRQHSDIALTIDPRNPLPINPFRRSGDRRLDFNAARGMLSYFLSGMLDQPLTENHTTILENVLELIFEIPDASLYTLLDILDPNRKDLKEYDHYIDRIVDPHGFIQRFLHRDLFFNRIFSPRREEIVSRLYAMLRDHTFRAMLSDPQAQFCLADEINEGRIILVDCDKNYLTNRSEIFGRFFIALIHQAALARSSYPPGKKKTPTYIFIDECHDFIRNDERIYEILEQARKQRIGVILANQFTSQISNTRVLHSLFSATGTKLVARTSTETAALAKWLHCSEEDIANTPKHHFVCYTEGMAGPIYATFPPDQGLGDTIATPATSPAHAALAAKWFRAHLRLIEAKQAQDWDRVAELQNGIIPQIDRDLDALLDPVPQQPEPPAPPKPDIAVRWDTGAQPTAQFGFTLDFGEPPPPPRAAPKPTQKTASPKPPPSPAKTGGFELEEPELL